MSIVNSCCILALCASLWYVESLYNQGFEIYYLFTDKWMVEILLSNKDLLAQTLTFFSYLGTNSFLLEWTSFQKWFSLTLCCFVVYSMRRYVLCLTLCYFVLVFFSPFSIAITSLVEEGGNLSVFVRFFDLRLSGFLCFLFLLVSGKGCGLWLWYSLDFSLTFIGVRKPKKKSRYLLC